MKFSVPSTFRVGESPWTELSWWPTCLVVSKYPSVSRCITTCGERQLSQPMRLMDKNIKEKRRDSICWELQTSWNFFTSVQSPLSGFSNPSSAAKMQVWKFQLCENFKCVNMLAQVHRGCHLAILSKETSICMVVFAKKAPSHLSRTGLQKREEYLAHF